MNKTNDDCDIESYILNENNQYISVKVVETILMRYKINHKVKYLKNFQIAMTPTQYTRQSPEYSRIPKLVKEKGIKPTKDKSKCIPLQETSYQRLEFLGDSMIHLILAKYLFDRYPNEQEGFMTRLRTKIENGETLSRFSVAMGLDKYALLPKNLDDINGRVNNYKILEDIFEAFIGSLFLESDLDTCTRLVVSLLEENINLPSLIHNETNHKDTLLQHYHKLKWPDPEYGMTGHVKKDNKKIFMAYVKGYITNKKGVKEWIIIGEGAGMSKITGEQEAARKALLTLGVIKDGDNNDIEEVTTFNYN